MRLLHITDTHLHADRAQRLRGVDTYRTLTRVLDRAAAEAAPADAVLATGDLSQDETRESYEHFRDLVARLERPVWCLPGNHDAPHHMQAVLALAPFSIGGARLHGNWCVVLLDRYVAGDHGGRLAAYQLAWLEKTLGEQRARHVLIAVHHHPLPLPSRWLDELGLYNAADLIAIVDRSPQVRAVLAGHVHQASDTVRNAVRFLTTPSTWGGDQLRFLESARSIQTQLPWPEWSKEITYLPFNLKILDGTGQGGHDVPEPRPARLDHRAGYSDHHDGWASLPDDLCDVAHGLGGDPA